MSLQNLSTSNPFDASADDETRVKGNIHIRIQQRNGRKSVTTVQGLSTDFDLKRIIKAFKKEFACNGTVVEDEELGEVIQLQGDHRQKVYQFLIDEKIAKKDHVKMHGF